MEWLLGGLVAIVALALWINRVNARYERRDEAARAAGPSADERVSEAWDAFGLEEDPERARASLRSLVREGAPLEQLRDKHSLARLGVMATRVGAHELLPALAARATELSAGCGETLSLQGLAAAYAGDDPRAAAELLLRAQGATAGCTGCGASVDAKVLGAEVAMALDALGEELRAARRPGATAGAACEVGSASAAADGDEAPLRVRFVPASES